MNHKWNNSYLNCGWVRNRSLNMNYFIYTSCHFTPHGRDKLNKLISLPMCGFIAQLVVHRTGITEVPGSNPFEALAFFRLLLSNCLNWKFTVMIILHSHSVQFCNFLCFLYIVIHHHRAERSTKQNEGKNKPQRVQNSYNLKSLRSPDHQSNTAQDVCLNIRYR